MSLSTVWESLKAYLSRQIIYFCANQKRKASEHLIKLANEILELDATVYTAMHLPQHYKNVS